MISYEPIKILGIILFCLRLVGEVIIIKIEEIRKYLIDNPQNFSSKNNIEIQNISSGNKYYFIGNCGHEFLALPCNVFSTGELGCPFCCGKRVLKGFNDMWTTDPELADLLSNYEDGFKYTANTNKKLKWTCKNCKKEFDMCPAKLKNRINKCPYCNKNKSYGEKFLCNLFDQLYIPFKIHVKFEWSNNKEYDFYIPEYNCIVEVNGKQHYSSSDFSYLGGRHYYEEIANDEYKKEMALKNNILNYIVINAKESNMNWIKNSICNSNLPIILNFNYKEIEWDECNKYALSNNVKLICEKYNEFKSIYFVADYFHCSYNTVKNKLKQGAINGWCNYDAKRTTKETNIKNGKRVIETMSKPVAQFDTKGNFINKYSSIQQAQRELKCSHICDCIKGKRKTAGGFQWRYIDMCDDVGLVSYKKSGKPYKKVNQYDKNMNLIKTWDSIAQAVKETNIKNIIATCNKKQKTAGGFIWRYYDDFDQ